MVLYWRKDNQVVKLVLELILAYWHSLAFIPKVVLEKIRNRCFKFLWFGKKDNNRIPRLRSGKPFLSQNNRVMGAKKNPFFFVRH